jgi:hypothetical protein
VISVVQKNDHGWWYGINEYDEDAPKGYFPKNYVRERKIAPKPPPRPESLSVRKSETEKLVMNTNNIDLNKSNIPKNESKTYSVKSIQAFDDITNHGYAVEIELPILSSIKSDNIKIQTGMRVELYCVAMIWEGGSTNTIEFSKGNLSFVVGLEQVTSGLDNAVKALSVGDYATITCSPSKAYGAAGNPPLVPPNAFIVYQVEVKKATLSFDTTAPSGPPELLGSGIASIRKAKHSHHTHRNHDAKVVLVDKNDNLLENSNNFKSNSSEHN